MESQGMLEGLGDLNNYSRFKENSTRRMIEEFFKTHEPTPEALDYANSLICVARNIDRYISNPVPKNISTLMDSYNATMTELRGLYPDSVELSDDLTQLLSEAAK